jgi:DNA-binding MarR family transcriptional regulator
MVVQLEETRENVAWIDDRAPETLDLARFLPYRLAMLSNQIALGINRLHEIEHGLSTAEWRLIAAIAGQRYITANDVCALAGLDKVRISRAVARCLARGLISRTPDLNDRRRQMLTLTPAGRRLHDLILPQLVDYETRLLAGLLEAERLAMFTLLDRIGQSAQDLDRAG